MKLRIIAAVVGTPFVLSATPVQAQAWNRCTSGSGVIRGIVRDDSTGAVLSGSRVTLLVRMCRTVSDTTGQFVFARLPAGSDRIDAGLAGYRRFRPIATTVAAGQTTEVELRLRPGGPIEDCRVNTACEPLLRESVTTALDEAQQLRLAAYAAAIAIAWTHISHEPRWYVCIEADSPLVREELARRYGPVAPRSDCHADDRIHHVPTGQTAFYVHAGGFEPTNSGRRRVGLSFAVPGRYGQGWRCDFERVDGAWRPALCAMVFES